MASSSEIINTRILLEFKAGRMWLENNKMLPDSKTGSIKIIKDIDGLIHFQWLEREKNINNTQNLITDIVIFPGESLFHKIGSSESQRVYELKFEDDHSRNLFFWMQEVETSRDNDICQRVNNILNPSEDEEMVLDDDNENPEDYAIGHPSLMDMSNQQQQQQSSSSQLTPETLSNIFNQMSNRAAEEQDVISNMSLENKVKLGAALMSNVFGTSSSSSMTMMTRPHHHGPSLEKILDSNTMLKYLNEPGMLESLNEFLPEEHKNNQEQLLELATSPQFHQQLHTFSYALQTGQIDQHTLGIEYHGYSIYDFLNGIQAFVDNEKAKDDKNKDDVKE